MTMERTGFDGFRVELPETNTMVFPESCCDISPYEHDGDFICPLCGTKVPVTKRTVLQDNTIVLRSERSPEEVYDDLDW